MSRQCLDCDKCSLWHKRRNWCRRYRHAALASFGCRGGTAMRPRCKLTREQVREMRRLRREKGLTLRRLAVRYRVSYDTARSAVLGFTHKGVGEDENQHP